MTFRVGQKVVCVDASPVPVGARFISADGKPMISNGNMGGLAQGAIYTIREILPFSREVCLLLAELPTRAENAR